MIYRAEDWDLLKTIYPPRIVAYLKTKLYPQLFKVALRWAINQPKTLKRFLELRGDFIVEVALQQQAQREWDALLTNPAKTLAQAGATENEILSQLGIETAITRFAAPSEHGELYPWAGYSILD